MMLKRKIKPPKFLKNNWNEAAPSQISLKSSYDEGSCNQRQVISLGWFCIFNTRSINLIQYFLVIRGSFLLLYINNIAIGLGAGAHNQGNHRIKCSVKSQSNCGQMG